MIEDPVLLLGRLRLGREEYCQRLLTMLILNGPYPRWNSRNRPSKQGTRFLQALDALSFGESAWNGQPLFVDEFDPPRRHELEAGSNPDYALLWDDRLWMVELKTERASHRLAQLPGYFEFAAHHHPTRRIDLTYLTPSMSLVPSPVPAGMRFAHVTWDQVVPLVDETWGGGDQQQRRVVAMLLAALASIGGSWRTWRATQLGNAPPNAGARSQCGGAARHGGGSPQARGGHRRRRPTARAGLPASRPGGPPAAASGRTPSHLLCPCGRPIRHVQPWLWSAAISTGRALTAAGQETGYELRLSRNKSPIC